MKQRMKTMDRIKKVIADNRDILSREFKVKEIGLFGSVVRGEEKASSDVDILVEFDEPISLFKFLELEELLSGLIGKKVDLVSKKALKPRIGRRILSEVAML